MNNTAKNLIIGFVLLNLVVFGIVLHYQRSERNKPVGGRAPGFTLPQIGSAEVVSLEQHRGKVVLLDFWATWCPPCREQMPAVQNLVEDESLSEKVQIFSINTDERGPSRVPKVETYLNENGYTFTTLLDDGRASSAYGVSSIPTLVVIRPDGELQHVQTGVHSESELRKLIGQAQKSAEPTE